MVDISKINGVEVGNISKIDSVETGNINTFHSGSLPAAQADPANVDMTSGDNDHPNGTSQTWGPAVCVASVGGTEYLCVAYGDQNDGDKPKVRIATWNGSALSWGDEVQIRSAGSSYANGICFDPNASRIIGSCMESSGSAYNDYFAYAATITTSGSGAPKLTDIDDVSDVYHPSDDGGSSNYNQTGRHVGNMIYDDNANRGMIFFRKGGPDSGSSHGGDYQDFVVSSVTIDDVDVNNNITVSSTTTVKDEGKDGYASYNQQRDRIVYLTQDTSGTYQAEAGTITGTGTTHTVASPTQYADQSVINHREFNSGSSMGSNTVDTHNTKIVFDDLNNVHHVLMWDDVVDDWIVTNFSVGADNSITWATSNSEPLRSNGIVTQFAGGLTHGKTSSWTNSHGDGQPYFGINIAYSNKRQRLVITGASTDDSSTNTQRAVGLVYSPTTGYNYTGNYHQVLTNAQGGGGYNIATPSGSQSVDETFLGGGVIFFHYRQNNSSGYEGVVYGYDPGVGQRAIAGGIFSVSNAVLATARSRNSIGIGTSRIASMTGGGTTTAGTSGRLASTEEYNGSVISAGGNMGTARQSPSSTGTLTAGLVLGGTTSGGEAKTSEEYNGSSFSNGGTANVTGGEHSGMCGTQTDAVSAGGYVGAYQSQIEDYNGTSWSDTGVDLAAGKSYLGAAGTSNDCIFFGGASQSNNAVNGKSTEEFNGTSISTVNSMSNTNNVFQSAGTKEDVIMTGGNRIANNDSEYWNGTSWATGPTNGLSSIDRYSASDNVDCSGTSAAVFFGGGTSTSYSSATTMIAHFDH